MKSGCLLAAIALLLPGWSLTAWADGPDRETTEYILKRYTVAVDSTRGGCTIYANPKAVYQGEKANQRVLPVLQIRGELGGTLCNGVFEFKTLEVNCATKQVAYVERIGSPSMWEEPKFYDDDDTAQKVCALPVQRSPQS